MLRLCILVAVVVSFMAPPAHAWTFLCDFKDFVTELVSSKDEVIDKIKRGAPDVDQAKDKYQETAQKLPEKTQEAVSHVPTSRDLGKTPTNIGKEAIKKAKDELLNAAIKLLGSSSLNPSSNILNVHPRVLTDRDEFGSLFTQAYIDADNAPLFVTSASGVAIGGYFDLEMTASFNGTPPLDEFTFLYGIPNALDPNTIDSFMTAALLETNLELFGPGEPSTSWIVVDYARNPDGTPAFDANGQINAAVRVWTMSDVRMVPEPSACGLLCLGMATFTLGGRIRSRIAGRH